MGPTRRGKTTGLSRTGNDSPTNNLYTTLNIVPPFSRLLYASFFSLSLPPTILSLSFPPTLYPYSLFSSYPLPLLSLPLFLSAAGESFGEKTATYGCRETRTISVASPLEPFSLHYDFFPFTSHNMCSCTLCDKYNYFTQQTLSTALCLTFCMSCHPIALCLTTQSMRMRKQALINDLFVLHVHYYNIQKIYCDMHYFVS